MTKIRAFLLKIKRLLNKVLFAIPSKLPVGMAEFDAWADSIIDTYDLPAGVPKDQFKFVLADHVINTNSNTFLISRFKFAIALRMAASKQIAGAVFTQIKEDQKRLMAEKAAAEQAKTQG